MGRNILRASIENASFSIIFQILFRCITFILNAFIIRTVGHNVLGIMNVRLLLLESTILFLTKEPIYKACLTDPRSLNWAQVINQIWALLPAATLLNVIIVYAWLNILNPVEDVYLNQYRMGCYAIGISCVIEQASQNVVLIAQSYCFVKLKVVLETIYILSRTFIFVVLVIRDPDQALNAFSIAQVASAVILSLSYYIFFLWYIPKLKSFNRCEKKDKSKDSFENKQLFSDMKDFPFKSFSDIFPGQMENKGSIFCKDLSYLILNFGKQSFLKQFLTEGEKYVMTIFPILTFVQQSLYDIVNNLGSLAARFIFRPIEENAYFYFSQMIKREVPLNKQNQSSILESTEVFKQLSNVVISIGLVILVFGQSYSYTFLFIYGGSKLVDSVLPVTLMRFHSFAIILLAINGITEAFSFATMSNQQLEKYNHVLVIFSVVFLTLSYILTIIFGPVGFIIANCINMIARIGHSFNFIINLYKNSDVENPLSGFRPKMTFLVVLIVSAVFTKISENYILPKSMLQHLGVGVLFFGLCCLTWAYENIELLKTCYKKYRNKTLKSE